MLIELKEPLLESTVKGTAKIGDDFDYSVLQELIAGNLDYYPIREAVEKVEDIVASRMAKIKKRKNLLMYDGTLLDRLCLYLGRRFLDANLHVLYSVRPCMDDRLILEVKNTAKCLNAKLVRFNKDCVVHRRRGFIQTSCGNVSAHIRRFFNRSGGTLVLSSVLNDDNIAGYHQMNDRLKTYLALDDGFTANRKKTHGWNNLFLFTGFRSIELFAAYVAFDIGSVEVHQVPLCYHYCHNEVEQIKLFNFANYYQSQSVNPTSRLFGT